MPIGLALIGVSFVGIWMLVGDRAAWSILRAVPYNFAANWTLSSVPKFLLMGYICFHAGLTKGLFDAAKAWLAGLPGGTAVSAVFGAAGFAAVTGSSVACAAAMGRMAIPEMLKQRYEPGLATGALAAAGTLGALIPPSILLIIYGIMANVQIGALFLGGLAVGLMSVAAYTALIVTRIALNPKLAKVLEIGMITPPIGLNVFVIKGVVGDQISLATIFRGAVWFIVADLVVVGLAIAFPVLITYLPSLMR
jgi:tripartite ATP-independent transporter DctM subunit